MKLNFFLQQLPAFQRFSLSEIDSLVSCLRLYEYPEGFVFSNEADSGESTYILVEGRVRLFHHDRSVNATLEVRDVTDGELFNLTALLPGLAISTTAVASTPTVACQLDRAAFGQLAQVAPKIAHQIKYMMGIHLARALASRNTYLRQRLTAQATPERAAG